MVTRALIDEFLGQKTLAFVGVSREATQFGNTAFRELRKAGYRVFPVHPELAEIDGVRCCRRLADLPEPVGGVVVMVAPERAQGVAAEAAAAGIRRIWFQQQGSNDAALQTCAQAGVGAVHDECLLMFLQGTGFPHRAHRFIRGLFGRNPR